MTPESTFKARDSGVYATPADLPALREAARRAGMTWREIDVTSARDKAGFLGACARALDLPAWFGGNWDALADGLKDLPSGVVLHCAGAAGFAAAAPAEFATAIEVFRDAAMYAAERNAAFFAFVDAAGQTLAGWPARA